MKKAEKKNKNGKLGQILLTKETFGVITLLFSTLCFVFIITWDNVFGKLGMLVGGFLFGVFGYFAYAVALFGVVKGFLLLIRKSIKISFKKKALFTLSMVFLVAMLHIISLRNFSGSFSEYLSASYNLGLNGIKTATAGGFVTALYAYWVSQLSIVGGSVVLGLLFAISVYSLVKDCLKNKPVKDAPKEKFAGAYSENQAEEEKKPQTENVVDEGITSARAEEIKKEVKNAPLFITNGEDFKLKNKRELKEKDSSTIKISKEESGLNKARIVKSVAEQKLTDFEKKVNYIKMPAKINVEQTVNNGATTVSDYIPIREEKKPVINTIPMFDHTKENKDDAGSRANLYAEKYASIDENVKANVVKKEETFTPISIEKEKEKVIKIEEVSPVVSRHIEEPIEKEEKSDYISKRESDGNGAVVFDNVYKPLKEESVKEEPKKEIEVVKNEKPIIPINREYFSPPLDLLKEHKIPEGSVKENHEERQAIIKQVLSDFRINVENEGYVQGPSITRYEVKMPAGVSVSNVLKYDSDLSMRLASKYDVRIEAPIPGKDLVGIEVANQVKTPVGLKEVLVKSAENGKSKPGSLIFALGKDIVGNAITSNLAKGPHYLVAGATGSGKSVCLNVMIVSLIMRYSPEDLRLILVDPKQVGFQCYQHLPHLLIDEIISEPQRVLAVLEWAREEMERRYTLIRSCGGLVSDIDAYNEKVASDTIPKLPRIVIIFDELADLMETCKKDMETGIRMLAQKARAAGIHLVLATQRPSVDIITGTIKANLPSRIALKVTNFADSQTILNEAGAEKLLGNGDMLFRDSSMPKPERYQGAWISDEEIFNVVSYIIEHNTAYFDDDLKTYLDKATKPTQEEMDLSELDESGDRENDNCFEKALWLAICSKSISISLIRRRFNVGYSRAGSIIDQMERLGYISRQDGSKPRDVLITKEEFEQKYGPIVDDGTYY